MTKLVVEVGMELDKHLIYYHDMLVSHGLSLFFACILTIFIIQKKILTD